jgi:hypothetical protein
MTLGRFQLRVQGRASPELLMHLGEHQEGAPPLEIELRGPDGVKLFACKGTVAFLETTEHRLAFDIEAVVACEPIVIHREHSGKFAMNEILKARGIAEMSDTRAVRAVRGAIGRKVRRGERDAEIVARCKNGEGVRDLADAYGMSERRVRQIVGVK